MHALIVVAHPEPASLTHAVAVTLADEIRAGAGTAEIADITAEGFDPRFTAADLAAFRMETAPPADVVAEQARLARADALALVFPVYWWSLPAILKGWVDRVFSNGWAYGWSPETGTERKLGRLPIHVVGLGASDDATYDRRGYRAAIRTQVEQGILDYCGAPVGGFDLLLGKDAAANLDAARAIGRRIAAAAPIGTEA